MHYNDKELLMEISLNNSLSKAINTKEAQMLAAERANILMEIQRVKCDLTDAYNNFNHVEDSLLVDYYTYQIKAYETMFEYLIKKAKAIGMSDI